MRNSWMVPLTGLAFLILVIVGFAIGGEPPDATDDPIGEIVDFYVENDSSVMFGAVLTGVAGTLFVFFGGYLRSVLRRAEGEGGVLSAVAFGGTIIFAVGIAIDSTISFALAEGADEIDPTAVHALAILWQNDFIPLAMGVQVFVLATGISVVRNKVLPGWLGWILILLGVAAMTPVGFFAFLASGLLIGVMSVMLAMRERGAQPPAASAPGSGAP